MVSWFFVPGQKSSRVYKIVFLAICPFLQIVIWDVSSFVQGKSLAPIPEAEVELEEDENEDEEEQCTNKETNEGGVGKDDRDVMAATTGEAESGTVELTTEVGDAQTAEKSSEQQSTSWEAIPQPKGHSRLDYSRWDRVEDESSEDDHDDDDDDEEDSQPQFRLRFKTTGVRAVK